MLMPLIRWDFGMPFSLILSDGGMDEEDAPEPERIRALLEMLAVPESFEVLATDEIGKELMTLKKKKCLFSG